MVHSREKYRSACKVQPLHPRANLYQGTCENTDYPGTVTSRCLSRHRPYKLKKGKSREAQEWCLRAAMDSPLGKCYRACIKVSNRGELYFIFTLISSPFFLIFCPSHLRSIMRRLHDPPHQHVLVAMSMHFVRFHGPDEE